MADDFPPAFGANIVILAMISGCIVNFHGIGILPLMFGFNPGSRLFGTT